MWGSGSQTLAVSRHPDHVEGMIKCGFLSPAPRVFDSVDLGRGLRFGISCNPR